MAKTYRMTVGRRAANRLIKPVVRLGLGPKSTYLLTVVGRKTGQARTTPVTLVESAGERWLVAPYGPVGWVHNVRAASTATLRRGGRAETVSASEVDSADGAPILRRYLKDVPIVRPFFDVTPDSPIEEFVAEAPRHPVFRLTAPPAD